MHTPYHHGDLPNALRCAAAEVIAEKGLGSFSLREVARRAGVSHAAPGHHFGDVRGLLTSLAIEGFEALHGVTTAAAAKQTNPAEKLIAMGTAYVTLATQRPAHAQVMFRLDIVDQENPELMAAGLRAYTALHDVVDEIMKLTQGRGADASIEALGTQSTFESALRVLKPGGRLFSTGPMPANKQVFYDIIREATGKPIPPMPGSSRYASEIYSAMQKLFSKTEQHIFENPLTFDFVEPFMVYTRASMSEDRRLWNSLFETHEEFESVMRQIETVAKKRLESDGKLVMTKVVGGFIATK